MAKVIHDGRWYDEQHPDSYYETIYETMVKHHAQMIWPRFHIANFKHRLVGSNGTTKIADFALIEQSYSEWWVVEVERKCHSYDSHVMPQVQVFHEANYDDPAVVDKLCENNAELDRAQLEKLVKEKQPGIYVIVNKPMPSWKEKLAQVNAILGIIELFRSGEKLLLRVDGEHPTGDQRIISKCRFENVTGRSLLVKSPMGLHGQGVEISIEFEGHSTEWGRLDVTGANSATYLIAKGPCPVSDCGEYELLDAGNGRYLLRKGPK